MFRQFSANFAPVSDSPCHSGTKLQITSSIWTFCGQKWSPSAGTKTGTKLVQNCKSQVASGRFVVRNGLQDGLL